MLSQKKFQIFISSTYKDLIDERQMAVQAIVKMGHIPAGMELFKAGASQWQTITKWIDESDIYVLILGGKYGSINTNEGKAYTHLEYEYALSTGMPVFALVLSDKFLDSKEKERSEEEVYEKENVEKYNEFKKLVLSKIVKFVDDIKDIHIEMQDNITSIAQERKLLGWSKGDNTENYFELLQENHKLMKENNTLKDKIRKLEKENEEKFSCGLSFGELKRILENENLILPGNLFNKEEQVVKTNLLKCFLDYKSSLASGVKNQHGVSTVELVIYKHIASPLLAYNLCKIEKGPGKAQWKTISLNDDGKRFLALLDNKRRDEDE